jgi:hypothetical protein
VRLRYVGQQPVSFMTLPFLGEVEPDTEFPVPDDVGKVLLLRTDIEAADTVVPPLEPAPGAGTPPLPRKSATSKTPEASAAKPTA